MTKAKANRAHKDRLFRLIFREKKDLLSLYNAVNRSHYQNPDELEVRTLKDVLYLSMKNDLAFLIKNELNLYEAQSTFNPNMPLRGLSYFSRLYQGYVESRKLDVYSSGKIILPAPRYIVFYNGRKDLEDQVELRLSDSFETADGEEPFLECRALMLNINFGKNEELMQGCRKLYEYSYLVQEIRRGTEDGLALEEAVDRAVDVCLENEILKELLSVHRAEVKHVILTEYNEELHLKNTFEEGREEGLKEGRKEGLAEGQGTFARLYVRECLDNGIPESAILNRLCTRYGFNQQNAEACLKTAKALMEQPECL